MKLDIQPYGRWQWISVASSALVCAIALVVLAGWMFGFLVLTSILPGMIPMNPAVAVCFLLLGLAIGWQALNPGASDWQKWTISVVGIVVALAAILRLAAYLSTGNIHIDSFLFPLEIKQVPFAPNRMAPDTAIGLLFGGIATTCVVWRKPVTRYITSVMVIGVLLSGLYGLTNYLFTIDTYSHRGLYIATAMHTAAALLLLQIGILAIDKNLPVIRRHIRSSPGGILMRRLLPPVILLPILLGWWRIFAEYRLQLSGVASSAATSVIVQIVLLGALVWAAAVIVDRLDDQRQRVLERLQETQKELLAAKLAAEDAARVKSQFVANMSHEIRTPLHGVLAMMELLAETPLDEQQRSYTQVAKASADALLAVISDILDFSKIEAGRLELESVDFDLRTGTEDTVYMMLPAATRKKLELNCGIAPDMPSLVHGDPVRLRQVLMNLLSNAIKFTDHGEISVRVSAQDMDAKNILARFEVHDTGVGIPPEQANKLFTAFAQVRRSSEKVYGGTGLGLAICRQIVELMGGNIDFESRPNDGSTFWFTIRLLRRKAVWLDANAIPETLRHQRVLLLATGRGVRKSLSEQLRYWNIQVEEAASPETCIQRLRQDDTEKPVDILFIEHQPAELNALKISQELHAMAELRTPTIIALVRADMHIGTDIQKQFGISGILGKPVRQSQLFDLLMRIISSDGYAPAALPATSCAVAIHMPKAYHNLPVLVAEDNEINQFVIREVLSGLHLQCRIVADGRQCVEALQQDKYALVLMDCLMPMMDGFESATKIRELEAAGIAFSSLGQLRIPIIALTANASSLDRQTSLDSGMNGFLTKPLDRGRLVELIMELVPMPEAHGNAGAQVAMAGDDKTAPMDAADPIDIGRLRDYFSQDMVMVDRLLGQFISQGVQQITRLNDNMHKLDWDAATRAAHAIKGTAACLFAESLQHAAKELEAICRNHGDFNQAADAWQKVQSEMNRCIDWLTARQQPSGKTALGEGAA